MKRSILTEKVARRGHHVSGEFEVDPLEWVTVGDIMTTQFTAVRASMSLKELVECHFLADAARSGPGYPVVDDEGRVVGMLTKANLLDHWLTSWVRGHEDMQLDRVPIITYDLLSRDPITIQLSDTCRAAAERMAQEEVGRLLVVDQVRPGELLGIVTRADLLKPRRVVWRTLNIASDSSSRSYRTVEAGRNRSHWKRIRHPLADTEVDQCSEFKAFRDGTRRSKTLLGIEFEPGQTSHECPDFVQQ